jgi:hypothetical protein
MKELESCCWECETVTDQPVVVNLRMPAGPIGRFPLCPVCYHAYFLPLAMDGSTTLLITRSHDHGWHAP